MKRRRRCYQGKGIQASGKDKSDLSELFFANFELNVSSCFILESLLFDMQRTPAIAISGRHLVRLQTKKTCCPKPAGLFLHVLKSYLFLINFPFSTPLDDV